MMALSDIAKGVANDARTERCEKHGEYASKLLHIGKERTYTTPCPQCAQEMIEATDEAYRVQRAAEERAWEQAALEKRLRQASIPARF